MKPEQVELAIQSFDRSRGTRLLAHLPLTSDQIRALETRVPPEAAAAMAEPANRVGRFWRVDKLGSGGMGLVYRGWEPELRQWVALKFLKAIGDDRSRAYFRREAQLAASLDHPNIAKIYEVGEHEGAPFIAMQFVDGTTLAGSKLRLEEKLRAVAKIAEAVRFAHERGVIHRDLKPANVMIDRNGQVYVMDFGLAKEEAVEGESIAGTNVVVGTPNYMAPEQARGKAGRESDVYSIGAILYEVSTGRPPYVGENAADVLLQVLHGDPVLPRRLVPRIDPDLEAIIVRGLEKDLRRRYASAAELAEDLAALLERNPLRHARRATWTYVLGKKIRKQPLLWAFGAAAVVAALGGGGFGISQLFQARREAERRVVDVERERDVAVAERRRADRGERKARAELAQSLMIRARNAAESGAQAEAMVLYAKAHETLPDDLSRWNVLALRPRTTSLEAILPHDDIVESAAFSPDGSRLATGGKDLVVKVWNTTTWKLEAQSPRFDTWIANLSFSPEGDRILFSDKNATYLWTPGSAETLRLKTEGTLKLVRFLPGRNLVFTVGIEDWRVWHGGTGSRASGPGRPGGVVAQAALSPNGETSAMLVGGALQLWSVESASLRLRSRGTAENLSSLAISPDSRRVATGNSYGEVQVRDAVSGAVLVRLQPRPSWQRQNHAYVPLFFSPDGTRLAAGNGFWDARTGVPIGKEVGSSPVGHAQGEGGFSPDGRLFLRAGRFWDAWSGELVLTEMSHPQLVAGTAFCPQGACVATWGRFPGVRIWTLPPGRTPQTVRHEDIVTHVEFARDGKILWTGTTVGLLVESQFLREREFCDAVLRKIHREEVAAADRMFREKSRAEILPGARRAFFRARDAQTVQLVDLETGNLLREFAGVQSLLRSDDGTHFLIEDDKGRRLLNVESGNPVREGLPPAKALGPGGRLLASWDEKGNVKVWRSDSPDRPWREWSAASMVVSGAFLPDERLVVSEVSVTRVWDLTSDVRGREMSTADWIQRIVVSGDGARIATLPIRGPARIWDTRTSEPIGVPIRLTGSLACGEFSPDGRLFLAGGRDGVARLFETASGHPVGPPLVHSGTVYTVAFRPDGRGFATGSEDLHLRLWDLQLEDSPGELLRRVERATGLHFDETGAVVPMDGKAWEARGVATESACRHAAVVSAGPSEEAVERLGLAEALTERGRRKAELKEVLSALEDFRRAIDLCPGSPDAYLGRGRIRIDSGDWDGAIADGEAAIRLAPEGSRKSLSDWVGRCGRGAADRKVAARAFATRNDSRPSSSRTISPAFRGPGRPETGAKSPESARRSGRGFARAGGAPVSGLGTSCATLLPEWAVQRQRCRTSHGAEGSCVRGSTTRDTGFRTQGSPMAPAAGCSWTVRPGRDRDSTSAPSRRGAGGSSA